MKRILKKISKKLILGILAILIIGAPLLYLTVLNSKTTSAAWYSDSWYFRKKLTIDSTKVSSGPHAYFPVMVSITDSSLKKAQSTGNDILFTSSDGTTQLNHEIEKFDSATGTLIAWVTIPSLASTADTAIYMYYGNSNATSQQNSANTWNENGANNFRGVWHLKEDPSGSAPQITDSTTNANNGTTAGSMTSSQQVTGKIDGSLNFDGNDYVDMGDTATLQNMQAWTYESWIKPSSIPAASQAFIMGKGIPGGTNGEKYFGFTDTGTGALKCSYQYGTNSTISTVTSTAVSAGTWSQIACTCSPTDITHACHIYINGTEASYASQQPGALDRPPNNDATFNFRLAEDPNDFGWLFPGTMDEARVSNSARSAGWIATEYNNQNSPSTFFKTTASEEKIKNPVLYFKFDEGQGTTANDSSGQGHSGTLAGTTKPTWQAEGLCVSGKCLYFDGSTSNIGIGTTVSNVQSVGFWVKPKTNGEPMVDLDGGTHYISASSGTITATGFSSPTIYVNSVPNGTLTANSWNYIEVTTNTAFTSTNLKVGTNGTTYLNGFIDEFKLYDYVRTAAQVKTDYASRGSVKGVSAQIGGADQSYLSNGLVGYWKMDESSGDAADSSGNGVTLTNNGTTTFAAGKFSNASSYNGSSQYLNTATAINGIKTISFWAYTPDTTNYFINLINSSAYITSSTGTFSATGFTSPSIYVNGVLNGTISANTWSHVVITANTAINANALAVGLTNDGTNHFYTNTSKIDEVRIYNRALSPKEVSDLYNWAPGPVGYWKMEESNGTRNDSSGNGNNLTDNSTVASSVGKIGKGADFENTSPSVEWLSITDASQAGLDITGNITVEAWAKCESTTNSVQTIVAKGDEASSHDYSYWLDLRERTGLVAPRFSLSSDGLTYTNLESAVASRFSCGNWHHIAGVYNGSYMYLYIDGKLDNSSAYSSGIFNSAANFQIGAHQFTGGGGSNTNNLDGLIDEVKIYNYARTQKQIVSDMNGGHPAVSSPVGSSLIHLNLDEGYNSTANNKGNGGSSKNGTVNSGTWTNSGKYGKGVNITGSTDSNVSIPDFSY